MAYALYQINEQTGSTNQTQKFLDIVIMPARSLIIHQ